MGNCGASIAYRIEIEPLAEAEIEAVVRSIAQHSTANAKRWLDRLGEKLRTLEENPERCPLAPESEPLQQGTRELLYGSRRSAYRILFNVAGSTVRILHVRHAARRFLHE